MRDGRATACRHSYGSLAWAVEGCHFRHSCYSLVLSQPSTTTRCVRRLRYAVLVLAWDCGSTGAHAMLRIARRALAPCNATWCLYARQCSSGIPRTVGSDSVWR